MQTTILVALSLTSFVAAAASRVTGRVVDEHGAPVPGARVSIHLRAPSPQASLNSVTAARVPGFTPGFAARQGADSRGEFAFSEVPSDAILQLCAQTDDPLSLDPCLWDFNANRFELPTSADAARPAIVLQKGYLLSVLIIDPAGLLPPRDWTQAKGSFADDVQVSLRTPVLGVVPLTAQPAPGGRLYQFTVPYDTPFPLTIRTPGLTLKDRATGQTSPRYSRTITIRRGSAPPDLVFELIR